MKYLKEDENKYRPFSIKGKNQYYKDNISSEQAFCGIW